MRSCIGSASLDQSSLTPLIFDTIDFHFRLRFLLFIALPKQGGVSQCNIWPAG
jgi:hypothetical protein